MFGQKNILDEPLIEYNAELYYEHRGALNKENAKFMLCTIRKVLEEHGVEFIIIYGTLLGAVREHDFIPHDEDMDAMIWAKDVQKVLDLVPEIEKYGITLRSYCLPWIITFDYKGVSCDMDILQEPIWPWKKRYILTNQKYVPRAFYENTTKMEFLGEMFTIPANPEKYLAYHYGKDWRIPSGSHGRSESYVFFWRYAYRYMQKWKRRIKRLFNKYYRQG